jgi:hypothetical protein
MGVRIRCPRCSGNLAGACEWATIIFCWPTDLLCCGASALRSMLAQVKLIELPIWSNVLFIETTRELSNFRDCYRRRVDGNSKQTDPQCSCVLVSASLTRMAVRNRRNENGMVCRIAYMKSAEIAEGNQRLPSGANNLVTWILRKSNRRASTKALRSSSANCAMGL